MDWLQKALDKHSYEHHCSCHSSEDGSSVADRCLQLQRRSQMRSSQRKHLQAATHTSSKHQELSAWPANRMK